MARATGGVQSRERCRLRTAPRSPWSEADRREVRGPAAARPAAPRRPDLRQAAT